MGVEIEPSPLVGRLITSLEGLGLVQGMNSAMERVGEFGSPLEARLTGIALDPIARPVAETLLDKFWSERDANQVLGDAPTNGEVIIGSGFHAAVYAATRVRKGFPRPIVLERSDRVGGTFAASGPRPTFYLNSRNRPGGPGLAGDLGASLNHLPGGIVQATNVGMSEYQSNADMGLVIRLTLAQYATVLPNTKVTRIDAEGDLDVEGYSAGLLFAGRVIIATGLGEPTNLQPGRQYVMSFPEFLQRMAQPWPLRGLRRVAVIGGGDSGKCAVESFLGLGPQPYMANAALDHVEHIDWYAQGLPQRCKDWRKEIRGRYAGIGRYLRSDRFGVARLNVIDRRGYPQELVDCAVIDGRSYDLVVLCVGNNRPEIPGAPLAILGNYYVSGGDEMIARYDDSREVYVVGPAAQIPFNAREQEQGIAEVPQNSVAMFRTGTKTALLAATLPVVPR